MNRSLPRPWRTRAAVAILAIGTLVLSACGSNAGSSTGPELRTVNPFGDNLASEGTAKNGGTLILAEDREIVSFDRRCRTPTWRHSPSTTRCSSSTTRASPPAVHGEVDGDHRQRHDLADGAAPGGEVLRRHPARRAGRHHQRAAPHRQEVLALEPVRRRHRSMRAVDPTTVEFTLKNPSGTFPQLFALPFNSGNLARSSPRRPCRRRARPGSRRSRSGGPGRSRSPAGCVTPS